MKPKFQVQLKIQKPLAEVFDAVVRPEHLTRYFVQEASGPLVEGATVKWKFAEVPEPFDVIVRQVVPSQRIVFEWPIDDKSRSRVEMEFTALDAGSTMVQISESGWDESEKGFESAFGNAGGWMHMMCCMKAYLEYGINLRAGGAK